MRRPRRQFGYALLMVMLVLVIAATSLTAIARTCSRQALQASSAQKDLQRRWGAISCSNLILADPQRLMERQNDTGRRSGAAVRLSIELGGLTFRLVLSDEQGKINPNELVRVHGKLAAAALLRTVQTGLPRQLAVQLSDTLGIEGNQSTHPAGYVTFDQVFQPHHPSQLIDPVDPAACPAGRVTCWTDGKVNFLAADEEVLKAALKGSGAAGQASSIARYVTEHPDCTLDQLIAGLELDEQEAKGLREVLTGQSNCYSLWIVVDDAASSWYQLRITGKGPSSQSARQEWVFQW